MKKFFSFFRESFGELKKVNWPSREDVTSQTLVVVFSLVFISVALAVIDFASFKVI